MTKKVPKKFGKSIDWTVTTDKKQINSLNKNIRTIAQQLDENPLPDKDQLNPKKNNKLHVNLSTKIKLAYFYKNLS